MRATSNEALLLREHDRFLRELARSLVRDAATAEDLAQETWLRAFRFDLGRVANVRAWLRKTLSRCFSMHLRAHRRREARERGALREEDGPATDVLVGRIHEQQALLRAVEALRDPYRTVILLRFFEGLPPRAIALRLAIPVETVRTRVQRGLQRLRELLDEAHGGRHAWLLPLASWSAKAPGTASTFALLLTMQAPAKLLLAALVLTSGALGLWLLSANPSLPGGEEARVTTTASAPSERGGVSQAGGSADPGHREAVAPTSRALTSVRTSSGQLAEVRGRVFTVEARPLPGVRVAQRASAGGHEARTALDGTFALPVAGGGGAIVVVDPEWRTVLHGLSDSGTAAERVLVVGSPLVVAGRVVDDARRPVARARLWYRLPDGFRTRFPLDLSYSGDEGETVFSAEDGTFRFATCAKIAGASLEVAHDGHRPARVPLDAATEDLVIVLERPAPKPGVLQGQVVDEHGRPVAGAYVSGGKVATVSDERGEFVLDAEQLSAFTRLTAARRGMRPTTLQAPKSAEYLVLRMHSHSLALEGRVVDAEGRALAGAKVWVSDPTFFGTAGGLDSSSEGIAGGGNGLAEYSANRRALAGIPPSEAARLVEPSALWCFVRTDEGGRFRLEGLDERSYRLRAQAPVTLQTVELGPFTAGRTDLRLVIPAHGVFATLRGKVVDGSGRPVAGATVTALVRVLALPIDPKTVTYRSEERDETVSAADGTFVLAGIPKHAALVVRGDGIAPIGFGGEDGIPLSAWAVGPERDGTLEVLLPCAPRCAVRVELATSAGDRVAFLDAAGRRVTFLRIEGNNVNSETTTALHEGKSSSLDVPDTAVVLLVLAKDEVVKRIPILLRPGIQNVLRS